MREVATTLTDYLLTVVCAFCAWRLARISRAAHFSGPVLFFAAFAAAALLGGTWHGCFSAEQSPGQELVWWATMLFAGAAAAGLALAGLELLGVRALRGPGMLLGLLFVIYAIQSWRDPRFFVSLAASVAGTLLCVAGLLRSLREPGNRGARLALAGLGVSVLAAIAQQRGVALDRDWFDYNATYHVLLLPALALLYTGFVHLARARASQRGAA